MARLYGLSERDCERVQRAIRKIEGISETPIYRRQPMFSGGGFRLPDYPQITITAPAGSPSTETLVKATHENRWLWCDVTGAFGDSPILDDKNLIMPPNPSVKDIYYFLAVGGAWNLHIYPGAGQTIIMPSSVLNSSRYVDLDNSGLTAMSSILILSCCAANTWICCDCTHSNCGP
jgi:hypothetical protein